MSLSLDSARAASISGYQLRGEIVSPSILHQFSASRGKACLCYALLAYLWHRYSQTRIRLPQILRIGKIIMLSRYLALICASWQKPLALVAKMPGIGKQTTPLLIFFLFFFSFSRLAVH